jgi:hypothetical protein
MKNPRTAPVLLALLLTLIISLGPGLPQAAKAAEPMTVEGTWVVTEEPPTGKILNVLRQGQRITIRRRGPGVYGVLYSDGDTVPYYGSPTEINAPIPLTFEELKEVYRNSPQVTDAMLGEAAAAGLRWKCYYKLSLDGRTLLKTGDITTLSWDQSGHLIRDKIVIKPYSGSPVILTRVPEPTAPTKTAEPKPSVATPPGPASEETETPEEPAKPRKPVAKRRPAPPKGGSPRPPELPAGGALSGN